MRFRPLRTCAPAILGITALGLCACSQTVAFRPNPSRPIHNVAVAPQVKTPPKMLFYSASDHWWTSVGVGVGGVVGGAIAAAATNNDEPIAGFQTGAVFRQIFLDELSHSSPFKVELPADAIFRLEVQSYGFVIGGAFTRHMRPTAVVKGELVHQNGTVVWRNFGGCPLDESLPSRTPEEWQQDPALQKDALRRALTIATRDMLRGFSAAPLPARAYRE
jgi:hypothetical protein